MKNKLFVVCLILSFLMITNIDVHAAKYSDIKNNCFWEDYVCYHIVGKNEVEPFLIDSEYGESKEYWYPINGELITPKEDVVLSIPSTVDHNGISYTITRMPDYKASGVTFDPKYEISISILDPGYYEEPSFIKNYMDYMTYSELGGHPINSLNGVTHLILPNTLEHIGNGSLAYYSNLKIIDFPTNYEFITFGDNVFIENSLKKIVIPEGTYKLGTASLGKISEVSLPKSLKKIGDYVINSSMNKITLAKGNRYFKITNGIMYSKEGGILYGVSAKAPSKITILKAVKEIRPCAFAYSKVKEIKFKGKYLNFINKGTFLGCINLTKISGLKEVKGIEYAAFSGCPKLKSFSNLKVNDYISIAAFWDSKKPKFKIDTTATVKKYAFKRPKIKGED